MLFIATVVFTIHNIVLISLLVTALYLYSQRSPIYEKKRAIDYLWTELSVLMWFIAVILIFYPITLAWFILSLYSDTADKIVKGIKTPIPQPIKTNSPPVLVFDSQTQSYKIQPTATQTINRVQPYVDMPTNLTAISPSTEFGQPF